MKIMFPQPVQPEMLEPDGHLRHSNYVDWLGAARQLWHGEIGLPLSSFRFQGVHLPVVELVLTFHGQSPKAGDTVEIAVWLAGLNNRSLRFSYRMTIRGALVAEGYTRHRVTHASGQPMLMPNDLFLTWQVFAADTLERSQA